MYPKFRLYYPGGKAGSFGAVAAGYLHAFSQLGVECARFDYRTPPDEDGFDASGSLHEVGLYVGEPTHLHLMRIHTAHRRHFLMIAPNGNGLGSSIVRSCKMHAVEALSPSHWGAQVVARELGQPCAVAPHGAHVVPSGASPRRFNGKRMAMLHFTSTLSDRKGTMSLLKAYRDGHAYRWADLDIKCDPVIGPQLAMMLEDFPSEVQDCVRVRDEDIRNNGDYHRFLCQYDLVVQPSRAEGFGLVPLEAAMVGIPSVVVGRTGDADYLPDIACQKVDPWTMVRDEEVDEDGYVSIPGEQAPVLPLDPKEISLALCYAQADIDELQKKALDCRAAVREKWSWENVVEKWLKEECL